MAAAQLRFLGTPLCQDVAHIAEQLDIALVRVAFHRGDECPGHSTDRDRTNTRAVDR